jgi:hypothetical protein
MSEVKKRDSRFRSHAEHQQKRRIEFLERQKNLRRDRTQISRILNVVDKDEGELMECNEAATELPADKALGLADMSRYQHQLCIPEFLIDISPDISFNWMVLPLPEGVRCLIIAAGGVTEARSLDGSLIDKFQSLLPAGSVASRSQRSGRSKRSSAVIMLDCIYNAARREYYAIDVLNWRDYPLIDCTAEFRFFWLNSKLSEDCGQSLSIISPVNERSISQITSFAVAQDNISALIPDLRMGRMNGLLFYHKEGHYEPGATPLVLQWLYRLPSPPTEIDLFERPIEILLKLENTSGLGDLVLGDYIFKGESSTESDTISESDQVVWDSWALVTADGIIVFLSSAIGASVAFPDGKIQSGSIVFVRCDKLRIEDGVISVESPSLRKCPVGQYCGEVCSVNQLLYLDMLRKGRPGVSIDDLLLLCCTGVQKTDMMVS